MTAPYFDGGTSRTSSQTLADFFFFHKQSISTLYNKQGPQPVVKTRLGH